MFVKQNTDRKKIYGTYFLLSVFEYSMRVLDGQRILWTAVEKSSTFLMLFNLYFYFTLSTLFT